MSPFWSGIAIGLGISVFIFVIAAALLAVIFAAYAIAALFLMVREFGRGLRRTRRVELAKIAEWRAANGLPPILSPRAALRVSLIRTWRILRHPIRERAFIAECFHAARQPLTHRWSDGLS